MNRISEKFAICVLAVLFILSACGGSNDTISPPPTPVSGNKPMTYTEGDGVPEITATPTLSPTTVSADGRINITVPVDSDTSHAAIYLYYPDMESTTLGRQPGYNIFYPSGGIISATIDLVPFSPGGSVSVSVHTFTAADSSGPYIYYTPGEMYYRQNNLCGSCPPSADTGVPAPTTIVSATENGEYIAGVAPIILTEGETRTLFVQPGGYTRYALPVDLGSLVTPAYLFSIVPTASEASTLSVWVDGGGTGSACRFVSSSFSSGAGKVCMGLATAAEDWIILGNSVHVDGNWYRFTGARIDLGSQASPVPLTVGTSMPGAINPDLSAYYSVTVTSGNLYTVSVSAILGDNSVNGGVDVEVDDAMDFLSPLYSLATGGANLSVSFTPSVTQIYIRVKPRTTMPETQGNGTQYTMLVN